VGQRMQQHVGIRVSPISFSRWNAWLIAAIEACSPVASPLGDTTSKKAADDECNLGE